MDSKDQSKKKKVFSDPAAEQLIYLMSHGLRGPATGIRWGAKMLFKEKMGPLTSAQKEIVLELRERSEELITLLSSILLLSRIQRGKFQVKNEKISLKKLLVDIQKELAPLMQRQNASLICSCDSELSVVGDRGVIHDIVHNVLTACARSITDPRVVDLEVSQEEGSTCITVIATVAVPILEHYGAVAIGSKEDALFAGGTHGLLVHLASALAIEQGIELEVVKEEEEEEGKEKIIIAIHFTEK